MKRSSNETISPDSPSSPEMEVKPNLGSASLSRPIVNTQTPSPSQTPSTPKTKRPKPAPNPNSSPILKGNGGWDAEKRGIFMDQIIAAGYKAVNLDEMATQLGMGRKQLVNPLTPGRKGSFREKAVLAVRGSGA